MTRLLERKKPGVDPGRPRGRRKALPTLWVRLADAAAVVVTCGLLLGFGWFVAAHWDSAMETCLRRYGRAHTAADTARVDEVWLGGGKNPLNGYTCGLLRRDGTLDRHRAARR